MYEESRTSRALAELKGVAKTMHNQNIFKRIFLVYVQKCLK